MTARQTAVAAAADLKWLTNSAAILRRRLRYDAEAARWWGMVRLLVDELGLPLKAAAGVATAILTARGPRRRRPTDAEAALAWIEVDVPLFESIFLANLSRALNHETPRRRGRSRAMGGNAIAAARRYGVDIGLLEASLTRTPEERLALLQQNTEFLRAVRRKK